MTEEQAQEPAESAEPQFDSAQLQYALDQLKGEQNLPMGIAAGAGASLAGAAAWALITVLTKFQIGWMAIAIGFLVGIAIRTFGKGIDKVFGIAGAGLALVGCALGNLLAACGMISVEFDVPFFEVLSGLDLEIIREIMVASFSPMDLLFYGIAVYEGYRLSFRQLTEQDIAARITGSPLEPAG
jgi:hypothetical protein